MAALVTVALGWPAAAGPQGPRHVRVIWQEDPSHEAVVAWTGAQASGDHRVLYDTVPRSGDRGAYRLQAPTAAQGSLGVGGPYWHHARLASLQPDTTYYLTVVGDDGAIEERHFRTAASDRSAAGAALRGRPPAPIDPRARQ